MARLPARNIASPERTIEDLQVGEGAWVLRESITVTGDGRAYLPEGTVVSRLIPLLILDDYIYITRTETGYAMRPASTRQRWRTRQLYSFVDYHQIERIDEPAWWSELWARDVWVTMIVVAALGYLLAIVLFLISLGI